MVCRCERLQTAHFLCVSAVRFDRPAAVRRMNLRRVILHLCNKTILMHILQ